MTEEGAPEAGDEARAALFRGIDWGRTVKRLTHKALRWCRNGTLAKDLAQDAMTHFVMAWRTTKWNIEADPTAFRALLYIMDWKYDGYLEKQERRAQLRDVTSDTDAVEEAPPSSDRGAEGQLLSGEAALRNLQRLRDGLDGFPLTLALLELSVKNGQTKPADAAVALGVDVKQIYTAEAQLQRHVKRLVGRGSDPDVVKAAAGAKEEGA